MKKYRELPDFRDPKAIVNEKEDSVTHLPLIEIRYGARDENNQPISPEEKDNFGIWMALKDENTYYEVFYKRAEYEGGNLETDELKELHQNIQERNNLVRRSEELATSSNYGEAAHGYKELMNEWKALRNFNLPYQQKIWEFFRAPMDEFYEHLETAHQEVTDAKKAFIEEAKTLLDATDLDEATSKIKELQNKWKEAGSAGRKNDQELWTEFREVCDAFFDKKHSAWEKNVLPLQEEARLKKQELVERAIHAANMENFKEGTEEFKKLMVLWKEAGYAGKDDQKLWDDFNTHQQVFFNKKQSYYDGINKELDGHYDAKRKLVEEAKTILNKAEYDHDFSYERTNRMKEINKEWKEIGHAGRSREQDLWKKLREVMDRYFELSSEYRAFQNIG